MNIIQVYQRFPSQEACIAHIEAVRWRGKPVCPYCGAAQATPLPKEQRHHCNACNTSFSATVGTIFHHTHLDLQKWFLALALILNAKKGISARQLGRDLEVNKNTAWRIAMQIRHAMASEQRELLEGVVEMDETYIGGKPRKGNIGSGGQNGGTHKRGRGTDKTPVIGMLSRGGDVVAKVVFDKERGLKARSISSLVRRHVDVTKAVLHTDEFGGYIRIKRFMEHKSVNHRVCYVDGDVHTNSIEGFWALLKRGIVGQYHKVSVKHLPKYLNEFCYRYNNRKNPDVFNCTISRALGV